MKAAHDERRALLAKLRAERELIGARQFDRIEAPTLYALAITARSARGRFVSFRGVRFPCKFGLWRYICDPQTGSTLVAVSGAGGML